VRGGGDKTNKAVQIRENERAYLEKEKVWKRGEKAMA